MITLQRRPSRRLVNCLGAICVLAGGFEFFALSDTDPSAIGATRWVENIWLAATTLFVVAAMIDLAWIRRLRAPEIRRRLPRALALHEWAEIELLITASDSLPGETLLFDDHPDRSEIRNLPQRVTIVAGQRSTVRYQLRSLRRGDAAFGGVLLQARSSWGLWNFTSRVGEGTSVRVYPNFAAVARFGAIASSHHTDRVGIRRTQRRGEGLEFHQLREYRQGDTMRQIDWKATSRRQQLISREYQDERDQRIVFMLDCSRRMRTKDDDLSHFDHAVNAMVLLSHVALRSGDAVGLLSFGEETRWLPTQKGAQSVNRILNTIYDLESTTQGSDFSAASEELCRRLPRRSLVILLTSLRSEDLDDLIPSLNLLNRRHLVLVVNLREEKLDAVLQGRPTSFEASLRSFGVMQHMLERKRVQATLRHYGTMTLDVVPSKLYAQLINRYYSIKSSGKL